MPYVPELQLKEMLAEAMAELNRLRVENRELRAELEMDDDEAAAIELCALVDDAGIGPERVGLMSLEVH